MSTENNNQQGQQKNNQQSTEAGTGNDAQKSTEISLPKIDRPEGPFEHSGETARWTEEEKQEKEDEANQAGNNQQ